MLFAALKPNKWRTEIAENAHFDTKPAARKQNHFPV
jgi:hypothetical protein